VLWLTPLLELFAGKKHFSRGVLAVTLPVSFVYSSKNFLAVLLKV